MQRERMCEFGSVNGTSRHTVRQMELKVVYKASLIDNNMNVVFSQFGAPLGGKAQSSQPATLRSHPSGQPANALIVGVLTPVGVKLVAKPVRWQAQTLDKLAGISIGCFLYELDRKW